jgi:hypothetical protein
MSLRSLFENSVYPLSSLSELTSSIESPGLLYEKIENKKRIYPNIDFRYPYLFCKFGIAKEYYKNSFVNVYSNYPYDGSKKEKIKWENSLSYLDQYVYDNIYPKTNGSVYFPDVNGSLIYSQAGSAYTAKSYSDSKYIKIKSGGPNIDNNYVSGVLENNLKINPNTGLTVQFWMKKNSFESNYDREFICDFSTISSSATVNNKNAFSIYLNSSNKNIISFDFYGLSENQDFVLANDVDDSAWSHYTLTFNYTQAHDALSASLYINGALTASTTATTFAAGATSIGLSPSQFSNLYSELSGAIGAITIGKTINTTGPILVSAEGCNQLVDTYIDDFRIWNRKLTQEEIYKNWFLPLDGGRNTDNEILSSSTSLYYKFNEGITQTSSVDQIILDYSGRDTNAVFVNYSSQCRITSSAFVDAGLKEEKMPIMYSFHPDVQMSQSYYELIGENYDYKNDDSFYRMFPQHLQEEDYESDNNLLKFSHIIGSYFDELYFQIKELTEVKGTSYLQSGSYNAEISTRLLSSYGINITDILQKSSVSEIFQNIGDQFQFERDLDKIKANIYKNIYNNLINTYKSKGTENSIKSILRSYSVDDELLKIKAYANNETYKITDNRYNTSRKKKYLDLSGVDNYQNIYATVYPYDYTLSNQEINLINSKTATSQDGHAVGLSVEVSCHFPKLYDTLDKKYTTLPIEYQSASIFGLMPIVDNSNNNTPFYNNPLAMSGVCVFVSKQRQDSSLAKIILKITGAYGDITSESPYYNIYDNTKWTFCITSTGSAYDVGGDYAASSMALLRCVQSNGSEIVNSFELSCSIAGVDQLNMWSALCKPYIGALRKDFSGTIVIPTQAQFLSARGYQSYLNQQTVENHAKDIFNYGTSGSLHQFNFGNSEQYKSQDDGFGYTQYINYVPEYEICLYSWDFEILTGSDSSGDIYIHDFSTKKYPYPSFQMYPSNEYYANISKKMNAKGFGFSANDSSMVKHDYIQTGKPKEINNLYTNDFIQIETDESIYFNKDINPIKYFFTVENSMYSVINEEILNIFHSVVEFNDIIGQDYYKYRESYKSLDKLRDFFFRKVNNITKVDNYLRYYKWFDSSIGNIIRQILPISVESSDGVYNVIESHILERNKIKYYESFLRTKEYSFEGTLINYRSRWNPANAGQKIDIETWTPQIRQRVLKIN